MMADNQRQYPKRRIRRTFARQTIGTKSEVMRGSISARKQIAQQGKDQRAAFIRKKSEPLMCSICEGPAHGYNFNAITCESCKAFFRRNALKSKGKFKCRFDNDGCVINMASRKRCKSCRLQKCFDKGMRADWILTDEERINKRLKIEENRRLRQLLYPNSPKTDDCEPMEAEAECFDSIDDFDLDEDLKTLFREENYIPVSSSLTPADLMKIEQIQQAYADSVRLTPLPSNVSTYPQITRINVTADMINLPANIQATRLITYFKLLPEFSSLSQNDKLILVKYHTLPLTIIRGALNYNPSDDTYHEPDTDECIFDGRDIVQCFSFDDYEQSTRCIRRLYDASQNDRFLLQTLLVIILFSKGSSICTCEEEDEPLAEDTRSIYHNQNIFVDLLWKYCEEKFGVQKTREIFIAFTMCSMDAHLQTQHFRQSYRKLDPQVDNVAPIMKSIMLLV